MQEIEYKGIDEKVYTETLDNGLRVYMVVNEKVNNTYMSLTVKYGSRDTEFKCKDDKKYTKVHDGVAHFLEHIMFNEEDGKTAHDYFNTLGSSTNAFTTFDFTLYEVFATVEFQKNLEHLLDFVQKSVIPKDIVKKEKGIIVEEVRMGNNNPGHKLYYGTNNALFKKNKRGIKITGEEEDVLATSVEELQMVFDAFYHPCNMILCITGNFNPYEAIAIVKENQAKKEFIEYKEPVRKKINEPLEVNTEYLEIEGNVEIPKVKICYKMDISNFGDIDKKLLEIYLSIILRNNFGVTSLLKEDLLEKELIVAMGTSREIIDNMVVLEVDVETKYPTEVIPIIKKQMEELSLSREDLKRRIRCNIAALINDFDDIEYVNTEIVDQLISYDKLYMDLYDIYNNLNMEEANKILDSINLDNSSTVLMVPFK